MHSDCVILLIFLLIIDIFSGHVHGNPVNLTTSSTNGSIPAEKVPPLAEKPLPVPASPVVLSSPKTSPVINQPGQPKPDPRVQKYQRQWIQISNQGIRPYEYGYNTGIQPYSFSYTFPIDEKTRNIDSNSMQKFNEPSISAPDESLNTIPLGENESNNGDDLHGLLLNNGGNDFDGVPAGDDDFPVQNNQGASGLDIPDLNLGNSDNSFNSVFPDQTIDF